VTGTRDRHAGGCSTGTAAGRAGGGVRPGRVGPLEAAPAGRRECRDAESEGDCALKEMYTRRVEAWMQGGCDIPEMYRSGPWEQWSEEQTAELQKDK
jgi:hypothetical protein